MTAGTRTDADVVVIGGGSTGTAVARDCAARGLDVTLLERGRLAAGTTGHMHGLLHSGARYAVDDPESARECIAENRVLREIAPDCVADAGGLFVQRPGDDDAYFESKRGACEDCDIPVEVVDGDRAREVEPRLAADVERALRVPDGTVDPFRLTVASALAAERAGARIEPGAAVTDLRTEGGAVVGVRVRHRDPGGDPEKARAAGTTEEVRARHVVNATGAWAAEVAALAGADVPVGHSQGAMVVVDAPIDAVVNWCRPRSEGDIAVPHAGGAVLGTTDDQIDGPDAVDRDPDDVDRIVASLARLLPDVADAERRHAYWGVRPLYDPGEGATTSATRDFGVVDHAERDGLPGLTSVVGGKVTTCRLMAERVTDAVCRALGVRAACETDGTALPDAAAVDAALDRFGLASGIRPPVAVPGDGASL